MTTMPHLNLQHVVEIEYTNHRGERRKRKVVPMSTMEFRATEYHPEVQWMLQAWDLEKQAYRDFAVKDIHDWVPAPEVAS